MLRVLMCPPQHYAIKYEINPWMKLVRPIRASESFRQWNALRDTLTALGVTVLTIPQQKGSPDMVFTANAGVADGNVFIPSHFRYKERQGETAAFIRYFKKRRYRIADVAKGSYFEGEGDLLPYRDLMVGGFRYRSELSAHEKVCDQLGKRLIALELAQPHFYHLDTCFFPLDARTAVYYPGAFDNYGRKVIERFVQNPVTVDTPDARQFACNAFRVNRKVVMNKASRGLKHKLAKLGYDVVETPTSEFIKAGGSVKCLLLRL
jgi:N-dimethylarginine dimethylaminohydrolase